MKNRDFLTSNFGIEIEFTGITRNEAARVIATELNGTIERTHDSYDTYKVTAQDQRVWELKYDGSIQPQRRVNRTSSWASTEYSVELVSPILTYDGDIETLQNLVRSLRNAGAFSKAENKTGIHIHLDRVGHTPQSLKNFMNIIHSRNDLLYKSLQIAPERVGYCKAMDARLVERLAEAKPTTFLGIEDIWYEGYHESRTRRYHQSRYHFLNLHSFFYGVGTVELRGFNGTLHAGEIRSYIVLALALNHQAKTQKSASRKKPSLENPKFTMRTWLNRIGFIGEEFKNCREHLVKHLDGNAAWRFRQAG